MPLNYLRVRPLLDVPVPLGGGRTLTTADCPAEGALVVDDIFVRRRIHFGELELLAEGAAALPPADPAHEGA